MNAESFRNSIYQDVYERKTNTPENLRAELESYAVDASKLDDATLQKMLDNVTKEKKFVVALADIKSGNALKKGKTAPLTPRQPKKNEEKSK